MPLRLPTDELVDKLEGSNKDSIRMILERHRKKGLLRAEERVKQRETGPVRYKVYWYPKDVVQVTENETQQGFDNPNNLFTPVQVIKSAPSTDLANLNNPDGIPEHQLNLLNVYQVGQRVRVRMEGSKYNHHVGTIQEVVRDKDGTICRVRFTGSKSVEYLAIYLTKAGE